MGDVWSCSYAASSVVSAWLVTRVEWNGRTFGLVLEGRKVGTEVLLSEDRFAPGSWKLFQQIPSE